jgi:hypothetical protein
MNHTENSNAKKMDANNEDRDFSGRLAKAIGGLEDAYPTFLKEIASKSKWSRYYDKRTPPAAPESSKTQFINKIAVKIANKINEEIATLFKEIVDKESNFSAFIQWGSNQFTIRPISKFAILKEKYTEERIEEIEEHILKMSLFASSVFNAAFKHYEIDNNILNNVRPNDNPRMIRILTEVAFAIVVLGAIAAFIYGSTHWWPLLGIEAGATFYSITGAATVLSVVASGFHPEKTSDLIISHAFEAAHEKIKTSFDNPIKQSEKAVDYLLSKWGLRNSADDLVKLAKSKSALCDASELELLQSLNFDTLKELLIPDKENKDKDTAKAKKSNGKSKNSIDGSGDDIEVVAEKKRKKFKNFEHAFSFDLTKEAEFAEQFRSFIDLDRFQKSFKEICDAKIMNEIYYASSRDTNHTYMRNLYRHVFSGSENSELRQILRRYTRHVVNGEEFDDKKQRQLAETNVEALISVHKALCNNEALKAKIVKGVCDKDTKAEIARLKPAAPAPSTASSKG